MASFADKIYINLTSGSTVVDLAPYAIKNSIDFEWGINGNSSLNNIADIGTLKFTLNNTDKLFSPNSPTKMTGFDFGSQIDLIFVFDAVSYNRFSGTIDSIKIKNNVSKGENLVDVVVTDWIDYAATFPVDNPDYLVNSTADAAIDELLSAMPRQPKNKSLSVGQSVLPVIFDATDDKTKTYSELSKLSNCEPGYVYLKHDKDYGETLVFENRYDRSGLIQIKEYPNTRADCEHGELLNSTTNSNLLTISGNPLLWIIASNASAIFDNSANDSTINYGDGIVNKMTVTANPKTYDSASVVLCSLSSPLKIASGQTLEFSLDYKTSTGENCNAIAGSMIQPVITTDYTMYTSKSGGTNISAYLSGSAVFTASKAIFKYKNTSGYLGYIRKMQARGIGIYSFSQVSSTTQDDNSINTFGVKSANFSQPYQTDIENGNFFVVKNIEYEKNPHTKFIDISFLANTSDFLYQSFLNIDIGDKIKVIDDENDLNSEFYVQKIVGSLELGGIVNIKLILRQVFTLALGLSMVACTFSNSGSSTGDALCYGNLPQINSLTDMTLTAWVNPTTYTKETIMSGWVSEVGGIAVYIGGSTYVDYGVIQIVRIHATSGGQWVTTEKVPLNQMSLIEVSVPSDLSVPNVWINGIKATTQVLKVSGIGYDGTPVGAVTSIDGMDWCIGNIHGSAADVQFALPFRGKIVDARVYNRLFTKSELFSGGIGDMSVTDGLVFQSPVVRTSELNTYNNLTLTSSTKVLDNIYGEVGTANGVPTTSIP